MEHMLFMACGSGLSADQMWLHKIVLGKCCRSLSTILSLKLVVQGQSIANVRSIHWWRQQRQNAHMHLFHAQKSQVTASRKNKQTRLRMHYNTKTHVLQCQHVWVSIPLATCGLKLFHAQAPKTVSGCSLKLFYAQLRKTYIRQSWHLLIISIFDLVIRVWYGNSTSKSTPLKIFQGRQLTLLIIQCMVPTFANSVRRSRAFFFADAESLQQLKDVWLHMCCKCTAHWCLLFSFRKGPHRRPKAALPHRPRDRFHGNLLQQRDIPEHLKNQEIASKTHTCQYIRTQLHLHIYKRYKSSSRCIYTCTCTKTYTYTFTDTNTFTHTCAITSSDAINLQTGSQIHLHRRRRT